MNFFLLVIALALPAKDLSVKPQNIVNLTSDLTTEQLIKDDQLTFLYFWATWCGVCSNTLTEHAQSAASYKGIPLLAVSTENNKEKVQQFIAKNKLALPIFFDPDKTWQKQLQVFTVPSVVLVKRKGLVMEPLAQGTSLKEDVFAKFFTEGSQK